MKVGDKVRPYEPLKRGNPRIEYGLLMKKESNSIDSYFDIRWVDKNGKFILCFIQYMKGI
jgi:hypothetical protein